MYGGNGKNIDIWRDPWIGDERWRFIKSDKVDDVKVVGDLIDYEKMEWRSDLVEQHFNERDKKCIYDIPLSLRGESLCGHILRMGSTLLRQCI